MKILHIITTISRGGAENHLIDLIENQSKENLIKILFYKGDKYWMKKLIGLGCEVKLASKNYTKSIINPIPTFREILKFNPSIIHIHYGPCEIPFFFSAIALRIFLKKKYKTICSKHNDRSIFKKYGFEYLERILLINYNYLIYISKAVSNYYEKIIGTVRESQIIYYGIPTNWINKQNNKKITKNYLSQFNVKLHDSVKFITLSRLVPQKNLDLMIHSFNELLKNSSKKSIYLLIYGDGSERNRLVNLVSSLNIEKHIKFMGYQDNISIAYSTGDCFLLSSVHEGFGRVLIEANYAKLPVIATNVGAIKEVLGDGNWLINNRDVIQFSSVMNKMLCKKERIKCYEKQRSYIEKKFSYELMLEKINTIYKHCT